MKNNLKWKKVNFDMSLALVYKKKYYIATITDRYYDDGRWSEVYFPLTFENKLYANRRIAKDAVINLVEEIFQDFKRCCRGCIHYHTCGLDWKLCELKRGGNPKWPRKKRLIQKS